MQQKTQLLLQRTFIFGVNTLKFLRQLPDDQIYKVAKLQVARSSTSIGANYEEAQGASSRRDFNHRISIAYREVRETVYWLRVLKELYEEDAFKENFEIFIQEADELKKIFSSIKLSSQNK